MVARGNPARRDWVGANRDKIRDDVYKSGVACWLCGKPIDWDAPKRSRWAPSVDHVVPRSKGGSLFARSNAELAHYGCNSKRGNRAPRPYAERASAFPTRAW